MKRVDMKQLLCISFLLLISSNIYNSDDDSFADSLKDDDSSAETIANETPIEFAMTLKFRRKVRDAYVRSYNTEELTQLLNEAISYKNLDEDFFDNLIGEVGSLNILCGKYSDPGRYTLVDRAVILGNHTALRVLLKYGALINIPTGFLSQTALHRAVIKGDIYATRILLEHGANIMAMDKNFKTPRGMVACFDPEINGLFARHRENKKRLLE